MLYSCLECDETFDSERSLHAHIKKHGLFLHDYFVRHFQRKNLLTGELLPFKDKDSYFETDFNNIGELYRWCETANGQIVKNYILEKLAERINKKKLKFAPNEIELYTNCLPSIDHYKNFYKSYTYACNEIGVSPLFTEKLPNDFQNKSFLENMTIITDTREQEPLFFKNQILSKLDIGDYGIQENFDYTFVDRKSEQDFKSTLSPANLDRFRRELDRCRSIDCYLFIVIESKLENLEINNKKSFHKSNMKYIFHNMRVLQHEYKDCCQFVFSGGRRQSESLIPMILRAGKKIWNVDLQYYVNKIRL